MYQAVDSVSCYHHRFVLCDSHYKQPPELKVALKTTAFR
jgi:hypothetical protein